LIQDRAPDCRKASGALSVGGASSLRMDGGVLAAPGHPARSGLGCNRGAAGHREIGRPTARAGRPGSRRPIGCGVRSAPAVGIPRDRSPRRSMAAHRPLTGICCRCESRERDAPVAGPTGLLARPTRFVADRTTCGPSLLPGSQNATVSVGHGGCPGPRWASRSPRRPCNAPGQNLWGPCFTSSRSHRSGPEAARDGIGTSAVQKPALSLTRSRFLRAVENGRNRKGLRITRGSEALSKAIKACRRPGAD